MRITDSQLSGHVSHSTQASITEQELSSSHQIQTRLNEDQRVVLRHESVDLLDSEYYESEKSSRLYSKSSVVNSDSMEQMTITQEELTNSLVSGVLEREVHIGDLVFSNNRAADLSLREGLGLPVSMDATVEFSTDNVASSTEMSVTQQKIFERQDALTLVSEGEIKTDDGREISFRLELDLDQRYFEKTEQTISLRSEDLVDPLVISLDGKAPTLSNASFNFDIDSDGTIDSLSRLSSGSGFLALDLNDDGQINDGSELFGPQSGNGYSDLAAYDENGDGWIDESDAIFSQLVVWQPAEDEGDGGSLISLKEAGVGAISLQSMESPFTIRDDQNNTLGVVQRSGVYLREDGQAGLIQQIDLAVQSESSEESNELGNFEERAANLESKLQQHLSETQEALFQSRAINLDSLEINGAPILAEANAPVITIVASQFQLVERVQESVAEQQSSFKDVVVEPVKAQQESIVEQVAEVIVNTMNNESEFNGVKRSDSEKLAIDMKDEKHTVLSGIIEDVLRPLHEQLKVRREKANDAYSNQ